MIETPKDTAFDIVIPTSGRASLGRLLESLAQAFADSPVRPGRLVVVHDGGLDDPTELLELPGAETIAGEVSRIGTPRRGPAAARNRGWRETSAPWVVFLDDDVVVGPGWADALQGDLLKAGPHTAGIQAEIEVPLPDGRRPTDHQRNVARLADAFWITADMVFSRDALEACGGFSELFPAAYREDTEICLRLTQAGWTIARGVRRTTHPVGPAARSVSLLKQRGNADDAMMSWLHGPDWRRSAGAPRGDFRRHLLITFGALGALLALLRDRPRAAFAYASASLLGVARFAAARIAPGPRNAAEIRAMLLSSLLIPPAAVLSRARGHARAASMFVRGDLRRPPVRRPRAAAVIFDRDGTLIHDVPYNGDPSRVAPVDGARVAVQELRDAGLRLGVVSNQSGVAKGLIDADMVRAVNREVDSRLGVFDSWQFCPHGEDDDCACRKPRALMLWNTADALEVAIEDCVFVGDIGSDVAAGQAAGARSLLIPTGATRPEEIEDAPAVAPDIQTAAEMILKGAV